jgi:hypothetical protein
VLAVELVPTVDVVLAAILEQCLEVAAIVFAG